jgi:ribosome-associated protein
VPEPIPVRPGVVVPADAITFHAVRSGGPGGQNVNKVASKVELRVDLDLIEGLDAGARERLRAACATSLDANGHLLVTSQRTRDQRMNLDDAREKVRLLVAAALVRPRPRRKTKPTRGSVQRRLSDKKHRSQTKSGRRGED